MKESTFRGSLVIEAYPDKAAWLAGRRRHPGTGARRLGSSDAPIIAGVSPYGRTTTNIYRDFIGTSPRDNFSEKAKDAMALGEDLEPSIRTAARRVLGLDVQYPGPHTIIRNPELEHMACSLDGVVDPDGAPGILELKHYDQSRLFELRECPIDIEVQVHHALAVTGWGYGIVAVLVGSELRTFTVERSGHFIGRLIEAEAEFLRLVESGLPPRPLHRLERLAASLDREYGLGEPTGTFTPPAPYGKDAEA